MNQPEFSRMNESNPCKHGPILYHVRMTPQSILFIVSIAIKKSHSDELFSMKEGGYIM
jgi:hypothetical protein